MRFFLREFFLPGLVARSFEAIPDRSVKLVFRQLDMPGSVRQLINNFGLCQRTDIFPELHGSLKQSVRPGTLYCCPDFAGLIDHDWSLQELLTFPYYKIQTY